jgi:hypothetical protein
MTQHKGRQGEWPLVKREPDAYVLVPDVYTRTDRPAAGPLRLGTVPDGVGPRGRGGGGLELSDYAMDRISPRSFDPMGTSIQRYRNEKRDNKLVRERPASRGAGRGSGAGHD